MTIEELKKLAPGDLVRHQSNEYQAYQIFANYGDRAAAIRIVDITNPSEWTLVSKSLGLTTPGGR